MMVVCEEWRGYEAEELTPDVMKNAVQTLLDKYKDHKLVSHSITIMPYTEAVTEKEVRLVGFLPLNTSHKQIRHLAAMFVAMIFEDQGVGVGAT